MELKDLIRIRRKELGLTLEQVGDACGVGKSTVSKWERGENSNMSRTSIANLAKALNVSPLAILGIEEYKPRDLDRFDQLTAQLTETERAEAAVFLSYLIGKREK